MNSVLLKGDELAQAKLLGNADFKNFNKLSLGAMRERMAIQHFLQTSNNKQKEELMLEIAHNHSIDMSRPGSDLLLESHLKNGNTKSSKLLSESRKNIASIEKSIEIDNESYKSFTEKYAAGAGAVRDYKTVITYKNLMRGEGIPEDPLAELEQHIEKVGNHKNISNRAITAVIANEMDTESQLVIGANGAALSGFAHSDRRLKDCEQGSEFLDSIKTTLDVFHDHNKLGGNPGNRKVSTAIVEADNGELKALKDMEPESDYGISCFGKVMRAAAITSVTAAALIMPADIAADIPNHWPAISSFAAPDFFPSESFDTIIDSVKTAFSHIENFDFKELFNSAAESISSLAKGIPGIESTLSNEPADFVSASSANAADAIDASEMATPDKPSVSWHPNITDINGDGIVQPEDIIEPEPQPGGVIQSAKDLASDAYDYVADVFTSDQPEAKAEDATWVAPSPEVATSAESSEGASFTLNSIDPAAIENISPENAKQVFDAIEDSLDSGESITTALKNSNSFSI